MQWSFIALGTVMIEIPGMHSASCLLPAITLPTKPSLLLEKFSFFIRGSIMPICVSEGSVYACCLDGANIWIIIHTKLRKQQWVHTTWAVE